MLDFLGGSHPEGLGRACHRVQPVGLIATPSALTPALVESSRSHGMLAFIAIGEHPVDELSTLVIDQRLIGRAAGT